MFPISTDTSLSVQNMSTVFVKAVKRNRNKRQQKVSTIQLPKNERKVEEIKL